VICKPGRAEAAQARQGEQEWVRATFAKSSTASPPLCHSMRIERYNNFNISPFSAVTGLLTLEERSIVMSACQSQFETE
jgi:hypothetical protein